MGRFTRQRIRHHSFFYYTGALSSLNLLSSPRTVCTCSSRMQWWITKRFTAPLFIPTTTPCFFRKATRAATSTASSVILKKMMLVSTRITISNHPSATSPCERVLAISLSFQSSNRIFFSAISPAPATTPGFRMTPPIILRLTFTRAMNSLSPTTTDPTGAQSPLLRQRLTLEHSFNTSLGSTFSSAIPEKMRAPSTWTCMPSALAIRAHSWNCSKGGISPSKVGNSRTRILVRGDWLSFFLRRCFLSTSGVMQPSGQSMVRVIILASLPTEPFSCWIMCPLSRMRISSPGLPAVRMEHWLPKTPEGTQAAPPLPKISAAQASSYLTVSSSPQVQSPQLEVRMEARISGVRTVMVSERSSI